MESLNKKIQKFLSSGSGSGYGNGSGSGSGYGDDSGSGYGDSFGYGISIFNRQCVYSIDSVPTIITHVVGNLAKGFILNDDLTLLPCFIAKSGTYFAHGKDARAAYQAALDKFVCAEPIEKRINLFIEEHKESKSYPAEDLFIWHHRLTGSCQLGRETFCRNKGINIQKDKFTVKEFVKLTYNEYGSQVIRQLAKKLKISL